MLHRDDRAGHLRDRAVELVSGLSDQSPTMAGWLALDLSQALMIHAKTAFGQALTPEQSDELDWLAARLRALSTEL
ncbi:MAG: hypothetical protein AAF264_01000 [Pseudomonadota bacterium]